jgi:hypothetical protein
MQQWYKCHQCSQDILYGTNPCPFCKGLLAWSPQGSILYMPSTEEPQQQVVQEPVEALQQPTQQQPIYQSTETPVDMETCWFCSNRIYSIKNNRVIHMHKVLDGSGRNITYLQHTITIPRCEKCASQQLLENSVTVSCGLITGVIALVISYIMVNNK